MDKSQILEQTQVANQSIIPKPSEPEISILIPVYNEIRTIDKLLNKVTTLPISNFEIIIVEDCSKDGTREFLQNWYEYNWDKFTNVKTKIIYHQTNGGKGQGIKTAIANATGIYSIIQDADLEYEPNEILKLLTFARENNLQAVFGSRFMGSIEKMKPLNRMANIFFNIALKALYNYKLTDMHTCYKMINTNLFKSLNLESSRFDIDTEIVAKLASKRVRIEELPITYIARSKQDGKHIPWKDGIESLIKLIKYRFK